MEVRPHVLSLTRQTGKARDNVHKACGLSLSKLRTITYVHFIRFKLNMIFNKC